MDSENPMLWANKGAVLNELGKFEEALKCTNKSLEIQEVKELGIQNKNQNEQVTWHVRGNSFLGLKKYNEAIKSFNNSLELYSEGNIPQVYIDSLIGKGNALSGLNKREEALECYNKVLELDPNSEFAKKGIENIS
jgi:tetratricopeptide (TPR) repeat protein